MTVTAEYGNTQAYTITLTVQDGPVVLTGTLVTTPSASVEYAAAGTYTITADPATATLTAVSTNDVVTASIDVLDAAAGTWTLILTAPTTGTALADTITVTATDPAGIRADATLSIAVTVMLRPAAMFTDLEAADVDTSAFNFGDPLRIVNFSVSPATVPVTFAPARPTALFNTWFVDNFNGGFYSLQVQPLATDPGTATSYSETITITATEDGRTPVARQFTFTVNPSPVAVTGLPSGADLTLDYAAAASTFTLTAFPTDATVTATSGGIVTAAVTVGAAGTHTLTITPPSTGTIYNDTVTITATEPAGVRAAFTQTLDFKVTPPATANPVAVTGTLVTTPSISLDYASAGTYTLTADPGATLVANSTSGIVTASIDVLDAAAGTWTLILTAPTTGTALADTITVTATDPAGTRTEFSLLISVTLIPPSTAPTAAPEKVTLVAGDGQLTVTWVAVSPTNNGGASILTYTATATEAVNPTNTFTCTATTADATTCTTPITGLTNGTEYSVIVVATNSEGPGPASTPATATPMAPAPTATAPTAAPTGVTLVAGNAQLTVTWVAVSPTNNGGASILTYTATATEAVNPTNTFTCTATTADATTCTAPITGLTNGVEYRVIVVATNSVGDSDESTAATATPMAPAPTATAPTAAPTGVTLVAGNAQLTVTWVAVSPTNNGGTSILTYTATATEAVNPTNTFTCIATTADATTCTAPITGLTNGVEYRVIVVATNSVGDSDESTAATATPMAPAPTATAPTAAPTGVTLVAGNAQLTVTWVAVSPTNNGGASILTYTATATEAVNPTNTFTCTATTADATTCTAPITGLTNGVEYRVIVVATNSVGDSAESTPATATPLSNDATLSMLTLTAAGTAVPLTPAFAAATTTYTADAPAFTTILTYTATATHSAATFVIDGTASDDSTALIVTDTTVSGLTEGANTITITVTAEDKSTTQTYTIRLTVPAASTDAALTTRLNEQILTRVAQAVTAGTLAAVAGRVESIGGGAAAPSYQVDGQASLRGLLEAHGKVLLEGDMEAARLMDDASFAVPLRAADEGDGGGHGGGHGDGLSMWGKSEFRGLDGGDNPDAIDWSGDMLSTHVGVDRPVGRDKLVGFALSWNRGNFDYDDEESDIHGDYQYRATNFNPYFGWLACENIRFWGMGGYGQGEIEISQIDTDGMRSDDSAVIDHFSLAGGFNGLLLSSNSIYGGVASLALKGDMSLSRVAVEEFVIPEQGIAAQELDSRHLRLLLAGEYQLDLSRGGMLTEFLEVGARYDGGDGIGGSGVEMGGGLRYVNSERNLTVEGNVRTLLVHEYDEWGIDLRLRLSPPSGRGLSLNVRPVWGKTQSAAERLWNDGAVDMSGVDMTGSAVLQGSLDTEVGYGVAASVMGASGLLTPYMGITAEDDGGSRLRFGGRFSGGRGLSLKLEGAQDDTAGGVNHTVLLRGELAF